jgi:hypothetical protein
VGTTQSPLAVNILAVLRVGNAAVFPIVAKRDVVGEAAIAQIIVQSRIPRGIGGGSRLLRDLIGVSQQHFSTAWGNYIGHHGRGIAIPIALFRDAVYLGGTGVEPSNAKGLIG